MKKIEKEILRKTSDIMRKHYPYDELLWMSIIGVELKSDHSSCTIYYEVMGDSTVQTQVAQVLTDIKHDLRRRLGKVLHLRRVPHLIFRDVTEYTSEIEQEV